MCSICAGPHPQSNCRDKKKENNHLQVDLWNRKQPTVIIYVYHSTVNFSPTTAQKSYSFHCSPFGVTPKKNKPGKW